MQTALEIIKKFRIPLIAAIFVLVIIFAYRSCGEEKVIRYEYERIKFGDIQKTISASGTVQVNRMNIVLSKMSGVISSVNTKINATVKKGQVLAKFDSTTIDQNLEKMKAKYDAAYLELQKAERDLESKKSMYNENLISKQGMENEEFNYKSIFYKFKQIKIEYDQAKSDKDKTIIYSPIDGIVINVLVAVNSPINTNQEAFKLAPTLKTMNLIIDVDESDIGYVQEQQAVEFTVSAFPEQKFRGTIQFVNINPIIKSGITSYQANVLCNNDNEKLKPGMNASAIVIVRNKKNVLRVLNQAFLVSPTGKEYEDMNKFVWRKKKSIVSSLPVERVRVETGLIGNQYTEITKNLKKGDEILIKVTQENDE
ncbi:MAG TPA: efflux RND transporter periplasmic adaptor subunit [Spirochaetota bacterium]|nr:efflux RND transporter periplasmic adaptor subunit [Spirochaetota bacterium]HSA13145.1 efflux RND transporter periplasmic adaptor subunit [Spirochaetota bacterium]